MHFCPGTMTTHTGDNIIINIIYLEDNEFLQSYFGHCTDLRQRNVIIITDEIYVKPQLSYQGGHVFGKAVNAPNHLATAAVSNMICSLFGGKKCQ